jgi:hypothetical protein
VLRFLLAALLVAFPASARTLRAGPGQPYPSPLAAFRDVVDGDTVLIEPGEYFECYGFLASHLTIAGNGPGVVLTDAACYGKALLVLDGEDTTIRNLTIARVRVPDGNGAAIRLEAPGLTLENVSFVNNQVGILAGSVGGEIRIKDCRFEAGGVGGAQPKYAVFIGEAALLRVERSVFKGAKGGQIASGADRTELIGNEIATGAGERPAEAVFAARGSLLMEDNVITVGPNSPFKQAAVIAWDEANVTLRRNRLVNATGTPLTLLLDWTSNDPVLDANQLGPGDTLVSTSGLWRHRASTLYHDGKAQARAAAGAVKRFVLRLIQS